MTLDIKTWMKKIFLLRKTIARMLPYWHEEIATALLSGKTVLITAHGNSLRGLVKYLDNISDEHPSIDDIPPHD